MDMIVRQNGARLYIRVLYISEDDDGLIDLLMELYTLSNYVPLTTERSPRVPIFPE